MSRLPWKALLLAAALLVLAPSAASAWTVTVNIYGAGKIDEVLNRFGDTKGLFHCDVDPGGKAENTLTVCTQGSPSGLYNSGNIVRLQPSVPTDSTAYARGWRVSHWHDGTASKQINCDPQPFTGDQYDPIYCEFQIGDNLWVDYYFDDVEGPQDTGLSGGPSGTTNSTSADFAFNAPSDPDAGYQCQYDPPGPAFQDWYDCGTPGEKGESFVNLVTNGTYSFAVRGKDLSGNVDGTPASRTWTVDTVKPQATLGGGPGEGALVRSTSASFTVGTNEGSLTCTLDGSAEACNPGGRALSNLAQGPHTFTVTAVDAAGNVSDAVTRHWTVDTVKPVSTVTGGPPAATSATSATFTVTATEGTLTCRLDGGPVLCAQTHRALTDGEHVFTASATDAAGNVGDTVTRRWTVDTHAPDTSLLGGPPAGSSTSATSAVFTFRSNEPAAGFQCALDVGAYAPCSSPWTLAVLLNGDHTARIRAVDAAGNVDPSPVVVTWHVNSLDVDGDGFSGGQDCDDGNGSVHVGAVDVPGDGIDQDCVGGDATVPTVPAGMRYRFATLGGTTTIVVLKLSKLVQGTKVTVTCRGKGCKFKSRKGKPSKSGALNVRKLLRNPPFKAGSKLTIRIAAPGYKTKVATFTMRRGKLPKGGAFRVT
jgi:hypothetical protein